MRADEKGGPTNGQPSTQQNHRFLELERPRRITWPNPLTPILKGSEMWPKSSSSKQARIPRHRTPSPALDYSSFPSFKLKGLREGKIKKGKAKLCSLCIPPAFSEGADGVNGRHQATRNPSWAQAHQCPPVAYAHKDILLQWVLQLLTETVPDQDQPPAHHGPWWSQKHSTQWRSDVAALLSPLSRQAHFCFGLSQSLDTNYSGTYRPPRPAAAIWSPRWHHFQAKYSASQKGSKKKTP